MWWEIKESYGFHEDIPKVWGWIVERTKFLLRFGFAWMFIFKAIWRFFLWYELYCYWAFDLVQCVRIWPMFPDKSFSCWDFDLGECVRIWSLCFWKKLFLVGIFVENIWGFNFWQAFFLVGIWFGMSENLNNWTLRVLIHFSFACKSYLCNWFKFIKRTSSSLVDSNFSSN